jgi:hypothetical protein
MNSFFSRFSSAPVWNPEDAWVWGRRVFAFLCFVTIVVGFWPEPREVQVTARTMDPSTSQVNSESAAPGLEELTALFSRKALFSGGGVAMSPRPAVSRAVRRAAALAAPAPLTLSQIAEDWQLVGVLNDGAEAAVSNKKTQETLYVKVGEKIGDLTLTAIHSSNITVSYQSQTMDLSL